MPKWMGPGNRNRSSSCFCCGKPGICPCSADASITVHTKIADYGVAFLEHDPQQGRCTYIVGYPDTQNCSQSIDGIQPSYAFQNIDFDCDVQFPGEVDVGGELVLSQNALPFTNHRYRHENGRGACKERIRMYATQCWENGGATIVDVVDMPAGGCRDAHYWFDGARYYVEVTV